MNSIIHTDAEAHGMFIIMTAAFAFKIQAKVALKSQSEQDVAQAQAKIEKLTKQLEVLINKRANFEQIHTPLSAKDADNVIKKLRSIRHLFPGNLPNLNKTSSLESGVSFLGKSNEFVSLDYSVDS